MANNNGCGAPKNNRNSLRHGLRASRLPGDAKHIEQSTDRLRRELEDAVLARRSEMSLRDAALVQSACRHERRALLLERWLRVGGIVLMAERLSVLKDISGATDQRDKCIERLDIAKDRQDAFEALYSVQAVNQSGDDDTPQAASSGDGGQTGDAEGQP